MAPLRRPRFLVPALLVAAAFIGAFAWASRGSDDADVITRPRQNCPAVARDDAAFTPANEPVTIDVLANDTDGDGDQLVFEPVDVTAGTATIDDGGTPTDAADDKLLYTPGDAPQPTEKVRYRVEDPNGSSSEADVTIAITDAGALPEGLASASVTDPAGVHVPSRCADDIDELDETTTSSVDAGPTSTLVADAAAVDDEAATAAPTRFGRRPPLTTRSATTTTVARRSTTTTGRNSSNNDFDDAPAPTNPPGTQRTTTTQRRSSTTAGPPPCTDRESCEEYGNNYRSSTTRPSPPSSNP